MQLAFDLLFYNVAVNKRDNKSKVNFEFKASPKAYDKTYWVVRLTKCLALVNTPLD